MVYMFFFRCFVFGQRWGEGWGVGFLSGEKGRRGGVKATPLFFPLEMMDSG